MVLPVRDVYWSHWGSEQRIMKVVQKTSDLSGDGIAEGKMPMNRQEGVAHV